MPTADDYRRAADDFEAQARALQEECPPLSTSLTDDVVTGGRLRCLLDEAIDAIMHGLGSTSHGLTEIAAECRRRAVTCEHYTTALQRYHQALHHWQSVADEDRRGPAPLPPPRPAPWVLPN